MSLQAESAAGFERAADSFAIALSRRDLAEMRLARGEAAAAVDLYRAALEVAEGEGCPEDLVRAIRTELSAAERAAEARADPDDG